MTHKKILKLLTPLVASIALVALFLFGEKLPGTEGKRLAQVQDYGYDVPADFDWKTYVLNYEDLRRAGINTEKEAQRHWAEYGKKEGRDYRKALTSGVEIEPEVTAPKALTLRAIVKEAFVAPKAPASVNSQRTKSPLPSDFEWETYVSNYGDLQTIDTEEQAVEHWLTIGSREGRTYKKIPYQPASIRSDFDWKTYVNNYPELRAAGIDTEKEAIEHWLNQGRDEGRTYLPNVNKPVLRERWKTVKS